MVNWQALADFGTVSQTEVDRLFFADDVESAYQHIVQTIGDQSTPVRKNPPSCFPATSESGAAGGAAAVPGGVPIVQVTTVPRAVHVCPVSPSASARHSLETASPPKLAI